MPSTIPYQQDLAIGQIVTEEAIDNLSRISSLEAPASAAADQLNSLIALKRSIDMTIQELKNMNIDTSLLIEEGQKIDAQIKVAAENLLKIESETTKAVQPLRSATGSSHYEIETPVDYKKSEVQQSLLSADSLKLNCEYIPMLDHENNIAAHGLAISSFVNETIGFLGDRFSLQLDSPIQHQLNVAAEKLSIAGTLVISMVCTRKNAVNIAPLALDAEKAVHAWNTIFPKDSIKTNDNTAMLRIASQLPGDSDASFKLITGATYASCFVAMIHIAGQPGVITTEALRSITQALESQFMVGNWMSTQRGFGMDAAFLPDNKKLFKLLPETSYCSVISLGATSAEISDQKQAPHQILVNNEQVEERVIHTNAIADAMQTYITACVENKNGIPVSYYLKPFTKQQLVQMWLNKHVQHLHLSL